MGAECVTIGPCTLYRGDCLQVLDSMNGVLFGSVVTDPPYSSGGAFRGDRTASTRAKYQSSDVKVEHPTFSGDNRDQRGWLYWCSLWLNKCRDLSTPGAILCCFCDWRQLPTATDAIQCGGYVWRGIVPWDKVIARPMPGRFRQQAEFVVWGTNGPREFDFDSDYHDGYFRVTIDTNDDREHSTQKPVTLLDRLVVTAAPGDVVLDPFMGSGTAGISCINTDREFVGIEVDDVIFDIACRRIERAWQDKRSELPFEKPAPLVQRSLIESEAT